MVCYLFRHLQCAGEHQHVLRKNSDLSTHLERGQVDILHRIQSQTARSEGLRHRDHVV